MDLEKLLNAFEEILRLKRMPRTGWLYYGLEKAESVADHSFGVGIVTLFLLEYLKNAGVELDEAKALKIALLHEIGEAKIGDLHLESQNYIGQNAVSAAEEKAVRKILGDAGLPNLAELWKEFEDRSSPEGKLVRAADKIELLLQAYLYEKHGACNLDEIFREKKTRKDFDFHEITQKLAQLIDSKRKKT